MQYLSSWKIKGLYHLNIYLSPSIHLSVYPSIYLISGTSISFLIDINLLFPFIFDLRYDDVVEMLQRQSKAHEKLNQIHDVHKMALSLIIVHLKREDYVAGDRIYKEYIE